jgi:predicted nucleic acid-binding protein
LRHIVIDANVFISVVTERDHRQREAAKALLVAAEDGELAVVIPQFVIFEIVHVLRNFYDVPANDVASLIGDAIALPGVVITDACPWKQVLAYWPDPLSSIVDAAIVASAITNRCDAVATFDRKLARQMRSLGIEPYW